MITWRPYERLMAKKEDTILFAFKHATCHSSGCCPEQMGLVSPGLISKHLQLPLYDPDRPCAYQAYLRDRSSISRDALASALCLPGVQIWDRPYGKTDYILRSSFKPDVRMWLHLVTNNIIPNSHKSHTPIRIAALIFLLSQGLDVDVPQLMWDALESSVHGPPGHAMAFPHLLTAIFRSKGIEEYTGANEDEYVKALAPMEYERLGGAAQNDAPRDVHMENAGRMSAHAASMARMEETQAQILAELQSVRSDQGRLFDRMGAQDTYLRELGQLLCSQHQITPPILPPADEDHADV